MQLVNEYSRDLFHNIPTCKNVWSFQNASQSFLSKQISLKGLRGLYSSRFFKLWFCSSVWQSRGLKLPVSVVQFHSGPPCGYGLIVRLQSSKLTMRVRFPLSTPYRQMSQGGELVSKTDCGGFDSLLSMPKKRCMSGWGRSGLENH